MHLIATARKSSQKLNERVVTKNAFDTVGLAIAFRTEGDDLILTIRDLERGCFRTMFEAAGGIEGNLIGGRLQRPFGERMVRLRPQVVIGAVAISAAFRTRIGGKVSRRFFNGDAGYSKQQRNWQHHPCGQSSLGLFALHT